MSADAFDLRLCLKHLQPKYVVNRTKLFPNILALDILSSYLHVLHIQARIYFKKIQNLTYSQDVTKHLVFDEGSKGFYLNYQIFNVKKVVNYDRLLICIYIGGMQNKGAIVWEKGQTNLILGGGSQGGVPQNILNLEALSSGKYLFYSTTRKNCFKTCNCMRIMNIQYIIILNLHFSLQRILGNSPPILPFVPLPPHVSDL